MMATRKTRDDLGGMDNMFHEKGEMAPSRRTAAPAASAAPKARPKVKTMPSSKAQPVLRGAVTLQTATPNQPRLKGAVTPQKTYSNLQGAVTPQRASSFLQGAVTPQTATTNLRRKPISENPFKFLRATNSGSIDRPALPNPIPTGKAADGILSAKLRRMLNRDRNRVVGPK
jgi:hypothetical protein